MQLSVIRSTLRRQVGNPTTGQVTDEFLNFWINLAYNELANKYRFKQNKTLYQFPTVAGTQSYALPSDCQSLLRVRNTTVDYEGKLTKFGDRRVAEIIDAETNGTPLNYARYDNSLYLFPTPDQIYTMEIYYKASLVDLAGDGDVPVLPVNWHYGLILKARQLYFIDQGEDAKAISAANFFKDWVSEQPDEVDEEKVDFDSGVGIPTLDGSADAPRLDFDHSD